MRQPITINLNDQYDRDRYIIERVTELVAAGRQSRSAILRDLIYDVLAAPYLEDQQTAAQPDPVDGLVGMIADLQSELVAMGRRIDELSRRPVVAAPADTGPMAAIDAIGESLVYDTTQNREAVPISEEFKQAIIAAAQKRQGMGKVSGQIEAPSESLRVRRMVNK